MRVPGCLGGIKDIFKKIHASKTVEKRNVHKLRKEVKNIDRLIETKIRELFFEITNS